MSALIRLYPRSWRARYEQEFLDLLEARPPTVRDRIDIVRGAIDARLDQASQDRSGRPVWIAATTAIAAGSLWIVWLLVSTQAFDAVEGDPVQTMGPILGLAAGLAAMAGHLALGFGSMDRMRAWGGAAAGIAAIGFAISAFGGGAAALVALLGSAGLAIAVGGRTVPAIIAVLWLGAIAGVFGAFAGLVRTQWTDPSVMYQAIPYGIVWVIIGLMIAILGLPRDVVDGPRQGLEA